MATTNSGKSTESGFTPNLEEAAERIRDLNEKMITASKQSGNVTLDAYEKTLKGLLEFQEKSASATQLDWVQAIAKAHATYITDVSKAFTSAARDALK